MVDAHRPAPSAEDRDTCLATLVAELVAGRLSDDDFEVRWSLALAAPTVPALNCLLDDLRDDPAPGVAGEVRGGPGGAHPPVSRLRTDLLDTVVGRLVRRYR